MKRAYKKQSNILLGILAVLAFTVLIGKTVTSSASSVGTVTASTLFMRTGPSTEYPKITVNGEVVSLPSGDKVVVQSSTNGWYYVTASYKGLRVDGYVSAAYIAVSSAVPQGTPTPATVKPTPASSSSGNNAVVTSGFPLSGKVTASGLNVRSGAGTGYSKTDVISNGTQVTVAGIQLDTTGAYWYRITYTVGGVSKTGYVSAQYVAVSKPVATPSSSSSSTQVSGVVLSGFPYNGVVTASVLNVRSGAGTSNKSIGSLTKGSVVKLTGYSKAPDSTVWYQVTYTSGSTAVNGYVSSNYITVYTSGSNIVSTPAPTAGQTATQGGYVSYSEISDSSVAFRYNGRVNAYQLNLRSEANTTSKILGVIAKDTPVVVVNEVMNGSSVWYRVAVKYNGVLTYGYMLSRYVTLTFDSLVYGNTIWQNVKLYTSASVGSAPITASDGKIITLDLLTSVDVLDEVQVETEKWFYVRASKNGVKYGGFIKETDMAFSASGYGSPSITGMIRPTPTPISNYPGSIILPYATPTPKPSPTPFPTPASKNVLKSGFPIDEPGRVTGYGRLRSDMYREILIYIPYDDFEDARTNDGDLLYIYGNDILILYDKYKDLSSSRYLYHVGVVKDGVPYYGYMYEPFIEVIDFGSTLVAGTDTDFEVYLESQGFPESYKPYLREIHAEYPYWVFNAYHTGLTFAEAVNGEDVVGKNLVSNSKDSFWKSTDEGAFDQNTGDYVVYDGSTWVTASREALVYFMDPRNFLNSTNIFMFETLKYEPSYQTYEGVCNILSRTPFIDTVFSTYYADGSYRNWSYPTTFIEAAKYSGVSPYFLASRAAQEVVVNASTVSGSVTGKFPGLEGLYNFYNIGAYHSTDAGGTIANALKYAKNGASNNDAFNDAALIPWSNEYNAIVGGAYVLGDTYVNRGQDTVYLQKFNVTSKSRYSHQYMSNVEAPYLESLKMANAYSNPASVPIVFSIPVYDEMPSNTSAQPGQGVSAVVSEMWLADVFIYEGIEEEVPVRVYPSFDGNPKTEYHAEVASNVRVISITPLITDKSMRVTINGYLVNEYNDPVYMSLQKGENTAEIEVTNQRGKLMKYKIIINRQ